MPILMAFLSETLVASMPTVVSPFAEYIIAATVSGHAFSLHLQYPIENISLTALDTFWTQYRWIKAMQSQCMETFLSKYSSETLQTDATLLFIGLIYRVTTLLLYRRTASLTPTADRTQCDLLSETREQASLAAKEIVNLINQLSQVNSFKVCPGHFLYAFID